MPEPRWSDLFGVDPDWSDPVADDTEDTARLDAVRKLVKAHQDGKFTSLYHYARAVKAAVDGPDTPQEDS